MKPSQLVSSPSVCAVNGCKDQDCSLDINYRQDYELYICATCYLELQETNIDKNQLWDMLSQSQLARESEENPNFGQERRKLADIPILLRESSGEDTER
jgi:hypothetical protein